MNLQTEITLADWMAFQRFVLGRASKGRGLLAAVGIGAVVALPIVLVLRLAGVELHLPSLVAGCIGSLLAVRVLGSMNLSRLLPQPGGCLLSSRQIGVTGEGVVETSAVHEGRFKWLALREVEMTPGHLFLMLDPNAALIVPRRAFSDPDEEARFLKLLREGMGTARS